MSSRPLPLLLVLLLAGCAHLSGSAKSGTQLGAEAAASAPAAAAAADPDDSEANLPKTPLTADVLFGVLASEISAQRGDVAPSAMTYLDLAKRTGDPRMAQRAAEFALQAGKGDVAAAALAEWLKIEPDNKRAREQLFITLLRTGKMAEARPLIEDLLKREPERTAAVFIELTRLSGGQEDHQAVLALVRDLAGQYPQLPEAHFALAAAAAEANDTQTVDAEFATLAKLAPKWDLPVAWMTERLVRSNQTELALSFLKRELARRPEAGFSLKTAYPRLLVATKHYDEARSEFTRLLAENPHAADVSFALGLLSFENKDYAGAEHYLKQSLDDHYAEPDFVRLTLGQLAEAQSHRDDARQWYGRVGPSTEYLQAQVRLAQMDAHDGQLDAALKRLDGLGGNAQERITLAVAASQLARELKDYKRAYQIDSSALKENKNAPELLYERALVAEEMGNVPQAEKDLHGYLALKPNDAQGLNALGYTLVSHTTRYKEAQVLLEKALKADPDNPAILDSVGWLHYKLGHLQVALGYLERAWAAFQDPEVGAHYGEVLWKLGRKDDARRIWQQAKTSEPTNVVLAETVRRLTGQP
jgi:tetratricopeptide (TPR) repeat protein